MTSYCSSRESVKLLLKAIASASCKCPAHSHGHTQYTSPASTSLIGKRISNDKAAQSNDYAFEIAGANIRYGAGVTGEIGMDFANLGVKRLCVMTDKTLARLSCVKTAMDSLHRHGISYTLFDNVRTEPTDRSMKEAIDFAGRGNFDSYLAIGGGSVMDTCKAANLYASKPDADFLDYVNAPLGRGLPVTHKLQPLIAIPTTAGTGSETTGIAIFDFESVHAKTGISGRPIKPLIGLVDPLNTLTMPERVTVNSGFDVLCHALESYTAIPYTERSPRPANPRDRPTYQGSNPFSDIWAREALRVIGVFKQALVILTALKTEKFYHRVSPIIDKMSPRKQAAVAVLVPVRNPGDVEARSAMHLASVAAGIGFGNAGVHLCHGMSYAISGNVRSFKCRDYDTDHAIIPHGLSVVISAPAVFSFTYPMCPDRHLEAAQLLGADTRSVKQADAGRILADTCRRYMSELQVEDGLKAMGFTSSDIPALVKGTLPQERVTKISPRSHTEADLAELFEKSMTVY